jgi:hypothetical protein
MLDGNRRQRYHRHVHRGHRRAAVTQIYL